MEFSGLNAHFLDHGEEDVGEWRMGFFVVREVLIVLEAEGFSASDESGEVFR